MSNFIHHINISNFKSIKECKIEKCKRINLFIGRPNVGKSNILEALWLFSIPYLKENTSKKLFNLIRLENETELFFNGNTKDEAIIRTDKSECRLRFNVKEGLTTILNFYHHVINKLRIDEKLNVKDLATFQDFEFPIKDTTTNRKLYIKNRMQNTSFPRSVLISYQLLKTMMN